MCAMYMAVLSRTTRSIDFQMSLIDDFVITYSPLSSAFLLSHIIRSSMDITRPVPQPNHSPSRHAYTRLWNSGVPIRGLFVGFFLSSVTHFRRNPDLHRPEWRRCLLRLFSTREPSPTYNMLFAPSSTSRGNAALMDGDDPPAPEIHRFGGETLYTPFACDYP